MRKKTQVKWLDEPDNKDYGAAEVYLQLLYDPKKARRWAKQLKRAEISQYAAKDILRASAIPIAEVQAFDWTTQQKKINRGESLAPILILRQGDGRSLVIADGFHRLCAVFNSDQEIIVPCKIV